MFPKALLEKSISRVSTLVAADLAHCFLLDPDTQLCLQRAEAPQASLQKAAR